MSLDIDIQFAVDAKSIVGQQQLKLWMLEAYNQAVDESDNQAIGQDEMQKVDCVIRLVDEQESEQLNHSYREKPKPTNVLSFAYDELRNYLGDLVICLPVVEAEALQQEKTVKDHLAHMVVHGTLHLLGFDHEVEADALAMESREIAILNTFGIANPYEPI